MESLLQRAAAKTLTKKEKPPVLRTDGTVYERERVRDLKGVSPRRQAREDRTAERFAAKRTRATRDEFGNARVFTEDIKWKPTQSPVLYRLARGRRREVIARRSRKANR